VQKIIFTFLLLTHGLTMLLGQSNYPTPPRSDKSLFYIQRSGNISTVVYDANETGQKHQFDPKNPIKIYWICYQENGATMDLNYLERKFAYGVRHTATANKTDEYDFTLVAFAKKSFRLLHDAAQKPYVSVSLSGKISRLQRVFIHLADKKDWYSLAPKVTAIELFGFDVATGAATHEKIIP
jgi:hypothetical protein